MIIIILLIIGYSLLFHESLKIAIGVALIEIAISAESLDYFQKK